VFIINFSQPVSFSSFAEIVDFKLCTASHLMLKLLPQFILYCTLFYLFHFPGNAEGSTQEPQEASQEIRTSDEV
jgi:hypothetical protein